MFNFLLLSLNKKKEMRFEALGKVHRITTIQNLPINLDKAWEFFSSPENLATITPDGLNFKILSGADEKIFPGQIIQYKVNPLPFFSTTWVTEITYVQDQEYFVDEQRYGPYAFWHHKHFFKAIEGGTQIIDVVDFKAPFGWIGRKLSTPLIKRELKKIFTYRNDKLIELFGTYKNN